MLIYCLLFIGCNRPENVTYIDEYPPVYPDYTDITIPYNIAPLNFLMRNNPEATEVVLKGEHSNILIRTGEKVSFAERKWRNFLQAEKGKTISVEVKAKIKGKWLAYKTFRWFVVADKIDPYLSYRLIEPGYEVWNGIQLRERHIESFKERVIADNALTEGSCMNCHTYGNQDPNLSFFHLRGEKGGTILNRNGELRKLNTKDGDMVSSVVYGSFHPTGRWGIFSTNIIIPAFHIYRSERLEVYDTESELYLLDFDHNKIIKVPEIKQLSIRKYRTFPVFSADGRSIYYCEAPSVELPDSIRQLKYSLLRIDFNPDTQTFGNRVDTLFSADETGQSVCHPKVSPDGKYLLYTVADYGTFPIWHRETDLQLLDLRTGEVDLLEEVNAECSDTYHSWSSNSRWFVFASKRDDGLYGKPYFSYMDSNGKAHKPFLLPQKDPAWYDYTLKSFNIPELSSGKLPFDAMAIEKIYHTIEAETLTLISE
ncbi:hypothetical protein [Parabacteroides sp. PF5-9]|uniref:TolB family protein n=1 Tax=Parabacteroides sp. PF5-9 TaxID=1742404 RepID=UPI00247720D6|nr:hypothetical protein [Parabacteroides sp. PF5-9]